MQYDRAVRHKALDQAMRWNLIARNPADLVDAPHPEDRDIRPPGEEQSLRVLHAAESDRLYTLYALVWATGMRQGELLGLSRVDVNWEGGALAAHNHDPRAGACRTPRASRPPDLRETGGRRPVGGA